MTEITKVYLDYNATTPPAPELLKALPDVMASAWGNPSSIHWAGRTPKLLIREARQKIAQALHVGPLEIIFTSGGSESNNTVIKSCWSLFANSSRHEFITTTVEHPSVMKAMKWCESQGAVVHYVPVSRDGVLDLDFFKAVLSEKTALVSVMIANNETGSIFPIQEIVQLSHAQGALVHSDCVQAFGKIPLDLNQLNLDFASISGHKFYAIKGTGLLYAKKSSKLVPLIHGGAQERSRRGGTENTMGIFAMGFMAQQIAANKSINEKMSALRAHMENRIITEISSVEINGTKSPRLPNTSSLVINGVDGETLLMSLDIKGFAVSTGAACASGNPEPSPVLLAMGLSKAQAQNSLRISLGWFSEQQQIDMFVDTLKHVVFRLRNLTPENKEVLHV